MRNWSIVLIATGFLLVLAWVVSRSSFVARSLLSPGSFDRARLDVPAAPDGRGAAARSGRRVFYSGHSLSDGVPEEVARIASSKGHSFEFEVASLPGSLIGERVAQRAGGFLRGGEVYDALVVTERHDLPYAARFDHTVSLLRQMHDELVLRDPSAQIFFYHVWLEIDFEHPEHFVSYERSALAFWECVASAVNARPVGDGRAGRVRVLPGGAAFAELVERMSAGQIEGAVGSTPRERVESLFRDRVHPSDVARYFMGAVHYAALFGSSPEGAAIHPGVSPELGRSLQRFAGQYVSAYAPHAVASSARDMAVCRDYASQVMCPLFEGHPRDAEPEHPLRLWRRKRACQAAYADAADPANPFH